MAKMHFKYGAMNSGKSDTLIKTAYNYSESGLTVLVVKPSIDTKGGDTVVSRGGSSVSVDIVAGKDHDIEGLVLSRGRADVVLVDEAQFLSTAQVGQLFRISKIHDISVICYGIRTDFRTKMFTGSKRLMELADNIEKLPTMCYCGSQAEFNARVVDGKYTVDGSQVVIDDDNTVEYFSLCGACYTEKCTAI